MIEGDETISAKLPVPAVSIGYYPVNLSYFLSGKNVSLFGVSKVTQGNKKKV